MVTTEKLSAQALADGLTPIVSFTYPTQADRLANTNRTPSLIALATDKVCRQVDTGDLYRWDGAAWRSLIAGSYGIALVKAGSVTCFDTIAAALAAASSGDVVTLGPGSYAESVTIPDGVELWSGSESAMITGALATGTRITLGDGSVLHGIEVLLPTDGAAAVVYAGTTLASLDHVHLTGAGALGVGIRKSGSGTLAITHLNYTTGTCKSILEVTAGAVQANDILIFGGTFTDVISVSGGIFEFIHISMSPTITATNGVFIGAGTFDGATGTIRGTTAIHITSDAAAVRLRTIRLAGTTNDFLVDPGLVTGTCYFQAVRATEAKFSYPSAWAGGADFIYNILDSTPGDQAMRVNAEMHIGTAPKGRELSAGRGDSTVAGMVVLTSDATATSTTEGGNITDVSAEAASFLGSTFGFQGAAINHTIMVCHNVEDADTLIKLKHWGLKAAQDTAGSSDGVYVFELWNGAAWVAFDVMASESTEFYRYADNVFLRPSSGEHIRFGIDSSTTWAVKTISSVTGYWIRIRITAQPTTAPVFQQFKLSTPRWEANENGVNTSHGLAMWRSTLLATGNVFGEGGTVVDTNIAVGSGGIPTGWSHRIKNSLLNSNGDAIFFQFGLPRGICTAFPLRFECNYGIESGPGTDAPSMILSVLPVQVSGVLIADGASPVPVPRTDAQTPLLTAVAAQTDSFDLPELVESKIHKVARDGFTIAACYEGDSVLVRIELDDDGTDNLDVAVWHVEVSGVMWTPGERL